MNKPIVLTRKFYLSVFATLVLIFSVSFFNVAPARASLWGIWRTWFRSAPPPPPRRGYTRGGSFCPIAPFTLQGTTKVWSDRPTFVWQGSVNSLEVVDQSGATVWQHTISEADRLPESVVQSDQPVYAVTVDQTLQPGQSYRLRIKPPLSEAFSLEFQILGASERDRVTQDLENLDRALATENVTGEAAATRRADYFAGQNLWLDFWQTTLAVPQLSEIWQLVNSSTIAMLCPILSATETLPSNFSRSTADGLIYIEHSFTGEAGQMIEIVLESADLSPNIVLLNEAGEVIGQYENPNSSQTFSQTVTLPATDRYKIRVQAATPERRSEYTLTVISNFEP